MTRVERALTWSGSGAVVSVFVAGPVGDVPHLDTTVGRDRPSSTTVFPLLQEEPRTLVDLDVVEFDAHFPALPADLAGYARTVLRRALDGGARVAWTAFEGSFHFDHLLTDDVAGQVYGVASPALGVRTALDDATLAGGGWADVVRRARAALTG